MSGSAAGTAGTAAAGRVGRGESALRSNDLCGVLDLSNRKIAALKNSSRQCVLALHDPVGSEGDPALKEGSASWFVRLWEGLLETDKVAVREYVGGRTVLDLAMPLDLFVHIRKKSSVVVLIYIDSRLEALAAAFFRNVSEEPAMDQALRILHDPHDEYMAFIKRAYDWPEEFMKDGEMHVWLSALRQLSLR
jgi:hypothetical protein